MLIISSLRGEQDIERGLALGANKYLAKPFTPEELRQACERLLAPPPPGVAEAVEQQQPQRGRGP
jgi:DNA-binding response OmpR family regulator